MFGTIRKHQTWLWIVIITLTIISFVIWFSPYARMDNVARRGEDVGLGSINGQLVTREAYLDALRESMLRYFFRRGQWPDKDRSAREMGWDDERETFQRLLLLQKARDYGIEIGPDAVGALARDILGSLRLSGPTALDELEGRVLRGYATRQDFSRFVRNELAIQQLVTVVGGTGGLMPPREAETLYRHEHTEVATEVVFFAATNALEQVVITPEALNQFYSNSIPNYRVPDRRQVSYLAYTLTNFWSAGEAMISNRFSTNINELVDNVYRQRGTNYYGNIPADEAKVRIRQEITREQAMYLARTNAQGIMVTLEESPPITVAALTALAQQKGLALQTTPPFDERGVPWGLNVTRAFTEIAFKLTPAEPVAGPIQGEDAYYIVALATNLPGYVPEFASVSNRVVVDFRRQESLRLTHAAGQAFHATLTNAMAQGRRFSEVCTEARHKPVPVPPFSRSSQSLNLPELERELPIGLMQELAFKVPPGKVSNYVPLTYGGVIVYVREVLPVDETKMAGELPNMQTLLRQTSMNEAFNEWFRKEAETGLKNTPLNRPARPTMSPRSRS